MKTKKPKTKPNSVGWQNIISELNNINPQTRQRVIQAAVTQEQQRIVDEYLENVVYLFINLLAINTRNIQRIIF